MLGSRLENRCRPIGVWVGRVAGDRPAIALVAAGMAMIAACARAEVVVDDALDYGVNPAVTGTWNFRTEEQHPGTYLDSGSRFASGGDPAETALYSFSLPASGIWGVEHWQGLSGSIHSGNPIYAITHVAGTTELTSRHWPERGDAWVSLGTFIFTSESPATVLVTAGSATHSSIDAIRFSQAGVDEVDVIVDSNYSQVPAWASAVQGTPPPLAAGARWDGTRSWSCWTRHTQRSRILSPSASTWPTTKT